MYSNILFSEINPIPVKRALFELKIIKSDELRMPLTRMENKNVEKLKKLIKK